MGKAGRFGEKLPPAADDRSVRNMMSSPPDHTCAFEKRQTGVSSLAHRRRLTLKYRTGDGHCRFRSRCNGRSAVVHSRQIFLVSGCHTAEPDCSLAVRSFSVAFQPHLVRAVVRSNEVPSTEVPEFVRHTGLHEFVELRTTVTLRHLSCGIRAPYAGIMPVGGDLVPCRYVGVNEGFPAGKTRVAARFDRQPRSRRSGRSPVTSINGPPIVSNRSFAFSPRFEFNRGRGSAGVLTCDRPGRTNRGDWVCRSHRVCSAARGHTITSVVDSLELLTWKKAIVRCLA